MNADPADSAEKASETDAEQVEGEWHVWLAAIVVVVGLLLWVAPENMVPELLAGLAPIFVAMGVVGWAIQRLLARRR